MENSKYIKHLKEQLLDSRTRNLKLSKANRVLKSHAITCVVLGLLLGLTLGYFLG